MAKWFIFLCCAVVAVLGQDDPVELTFEDPKDRLLYEGQKNVEIPFQINRGLLDLFKGRLVLLIRDNSGTQRTLFEGLNAQDAEPTYYDNLMDMPEGSSASAVPVKYKFVIKEVRAVDEGKFIVRFFEGTEVEEASLEINIMRPIESVSLQFSDQQAILSTQSNPFEVDEGTYPVQCVARGSNPAVTDLKLYFHNNLVSGKVEPPTEMDTTERRFKTTLTAQIDIKAIDSNHVLECVAVEPESKELVKVSVPIQVNKYDPVISCNETKAYPGMMYPKLICTVDHTGLDIKGFRYKVKSTGEEIVPETVGSDNMRVEVTNIGNDQSKVVLDLYNAKDSHFEDEFFLIVENENGYLSQHPVRLHRIEGSEEDNDEEDGGGNYAAFVTASMTGLVLSVLVGTLLSLQ